MFSELPVKDTYLVFKKLNKVKIHQNRDSVIKILSNKTWIDEKMDLEKSKDTYWIEFLNNGIMIEKFVIDSLNQIYLQENCWTIEKYEDFAFLVYFYNGLQGMKRATYQVLNINDTTLTISKSNHETKNLLIKPLSKKSLNKSGFLGEWISINDTSNYVNYDKYSLIKYTDTLRYKFTKDTLTISGNDFEYSCHWFLNADNTILIFEYLTGYKHDLIKFYVEYASILDFKNEKFKLKLFENRIETNREKPDILLNMIQDFKKLE
ncbi:hypothetical protein ACE01N_20265 [Saccharicrinis sp. FJH2]|uniref:hypothetical protein n=1 Tax=Saccharicrinis sp. FJH65 TaxID=3344659 RepID=UPI0035F495EA